MITLLLVEVAGVADNDVAVAERVAAIQEEAQNTTAKAASNRRDCAVRMQAERGATGVFSASREADNQERKRGMNLQKFTT